jgi:uncharacterized membrane protein (UPF0127 family)
MAAETVSVVNKTRDTVLGERIRVADTSLSRLVGLLGKRSLEPGAGLLIVPSQGIHTVAMRFAIDVVFADRNWRVLQLRKAMVPYRMTGLYWKARFVLELPLGTIAQSLTMVGDQLSIDDENGEGPNEDRAS